MDKHRKIYFICPKNRTAAGGVKQMYRMVDILNNNGFDAYILHKNLHREAWFSNNTKIQKNSYLFKQLKGRLKRKKNNFFKRAELQFLKFANPKIEADAIIVYPEIYGDKISGLLPNDYVIFNQNCYYTFENIDDRRLADPYLSSKNKGVIVVSEDSYNYLKLAYPGANLKRIVLGIDNSQFFFSPDKSPQIAYMPRKLSDDAKQLISILKGKPELDKWSFIPIENKTEAEVSEILRSSAIFLSFNHKEGFGLPPAEAMAAGCYVIGYAGQGGKEYFLPEFTTRIADGDIISFVEETISLMNNKALLLEKGKKASDFILQRYTFEEEEKSILQFWNFID